MDESFLDYLKRMSDEIREIQKNSAAESKAKMDRFDEQLAKSRQEFDQRMREREEEARKSRAEFDQRIRENNEQMRKSRAEFDQRMREREEEARKSRAEFDQRMRENDEQLRQFREEFKKSIGEVNRNLGGIGNTQGEIAEDLFRRNAKPALNDYGMHIDTVHHSLRATGAREYDIVAVNADQAVVFEIKTKLKAGDIAKFLQTQLPQFKSAFPEFKDYTVYGGVGALVMSKEQEIELSGMGLFVLTQSEDGITRVRGPKEPLIV